MSVSANFSRSYKIPRRQNTTGTDGTDKKLPSTASPLSKHVTSTNNSMFSSTSKTSQNKPISKYCVLDQTSNSKQQSKPVKAVPSTSQQKTKNQTQQKHKSSTSQRHKGSQQNDVQRKSKTSKRRVVDSESVPQKQRRTNDDPMELLDRIWKEMDDEDNIRRKSDDLRDGNYPKNKGPNIVIH